jgi:hypothetical protein
MQDKKSPKTTQVATVNLKKRQSTSRNAKAPSQETMVIGPFANKTSMFVS